jgi:hypothetical protein
MLIPEDIRAKAEEFMNLTEGGFLGAMIFSSLSLTL